MIRHELRWALLGGLLGLSIVFLPGCPKKCGPGNCAGCCNAKNECTQAGDTTACGLSGVACSACADGQACTEGTCVTASVDDGGVDAGPGPCVRDDDCRYLNEGDVCDTSTGKCIPGRGCANSYECQVNDPNDPCYMFGGQCRCDTHDAPDSGGVYNYTGTCRRRLGPCDQCQDSTQCGDDVVLFGPPGVGAAKCLSLPNDDGGAKYCLYQMVGQCACGTSAYVPASGSNYTMCKPQTDSCQSVGCNTDKQCSSGNVCTVNQPDAGIGACGGVCVPRCRWSFTPPAGLVAPGCPPGQTCWVDSANLDPTSVYYGSGRCKPPCADNTDCQLSSANPFGGTNLKCAGEKLTGGGLSDLRCRANGECMDNAECPELPNTQPYLGYCNRGSFQCKTDCRVGQDPVTGQGYSDCRLPYACRPDGGANTCIKMSCHEQGGAAIACSRSYYCCGDDKNGDGTADPCPPTGQDDVGCYPAPIPPFCTTCQSNADCANPANPTWMTCANGSKSPNCSTLPPICVYAGDKGGQQGVSICAPATYNDQSVVAGTVTRKSSLGCPMGYQVTFLEPDFVNGGTYCGGGVDCCASDADCQKGGAVNGHCGPDPTSPLPDGGTRKACLCTVGGTNPDCPIDGDAGITTVCRTGVAGQTEACILSVVCMPTPGLTYQPSGPPVYGCGL
jgi:hypothetical protein